MKRKISNQKLRELLDAAPAPESMANKPMDAEEFWTKFRARASLTHQDSVADEAESRVPISPFVRWRWLAPAMAAVVIAFFGVWRQPQSPVVADSGDVVEQDLSTEQLCEVREVEVFVDYASVMIMQDDENGGTILLLADAGGEPMS